MKKLYGLGTALITPFDQKGEIDYIALERLLDIQIHGKVDYIVVLGTTGEAVTLSASEKKAVRNFIADKVNGQIPLVLGVGGNNTNQVLADIKELDKELKANYSAILSVCPYYNKPSQEGLFLHFCKIAQASPIPVILYNVPGRTGVNLQPETVMRIHKAVPGKIMGVKEASGNIEQICHLIELAKAYEEEEMYVISGDDGIACEIMKAGGSGLISVASNAWPEEFGRIVREKDEKMQTKYTHMVKLLFKEGNPSGIKSVLCQKGIIENELRLPLVPNSQDVQAAIAAEMYRLGI